MIRTIVFPLLLSITFAACAVAPHQNEERLASHPQLVRKGQSAIASPLDRELLSSLIFDYINLYRSKHNLSILRPDRNAAVAAVWMADYQARTAEVSHVSNISGWRQFGERYRRSGGAEYAAGYENASWTPLYMPQLGRNQSYEEMAREIVEDWANSPGHRKALLGQMDGTDGYVGIGVATGARDEYDGIFTTMDLFLIMPPDRAVR